MYFIKLLLIQTALILISFAQAYEKYKIVETDSGPIRGVRNTTLLNGAIFYSFRGIPYAEAPIGDLRFKAPEPIAPWKPKIFDALDYGNKCPEPIIFLSHEYPMDEDCLSLNIFVPADVKPDEKMAVLFMIHGGSYRAGSSDDFFFGPDFLVEKQTILVTMNYRLGILGFLSLNSTEYSGNMGLKDQQLALKWIHSNIRHFGGDNKRITIIGQSAGGASVNFHILSAESRKYFHNAIAISGASENFWAMSIEENHVEFAYNMAEELNKTINSFDELVNFLKEVPIENIHWFMLTRENHDVFQIKFAPVIENPDAIQPFQVDSLQKLYESKIDVDALFTLTEMEMLSSIPSKSKEFFEDINANFSRYILLPFRDLNLSPESDEHRQLADEIREFYFGNATITEDSIMIYLEMMGDINMFLGIDQSVKKLATISKGKIYYMMFAVDSKLNAMKHGLLFDHMKDKPGVSHGDDLCYLFRCDKIANVYDEILRNFTDKESIIALQTIEYMTKLFTNFAKYGEPTYQKDPIDEILPVQSDRTHYFKIDNNGISSGINLRQKNADFWMKIKKEALELSNDVRQNEIDAE